MCAGQEVTVSHLQEMKSSAAETQHSRRAGGETRLKAEAY